MRESTCDPLRLRHWRKAYRSFLYLRPPYVPGSSLLQIYDQWTLDRAEGKRFFTSTHLLWSQAPRWGDLRLASQWVHSPIYSHPWSSPLETYFISIHGLISRNCADICNNLMQEVMSVFIWFQEWAQSGPESTVPMHPQPRPFNLQVFLDFCATFPQFSCQHDSPSSLAESQYPRDCIRDVQEGVSCVFLVEACQLNEKVWCRLVQ